MKEIEKVNGIGENFIRMLAAIVKEGKNFDNGMNILYWIQDKMKWIDKER